MHKTRCTRILELSMGHDEKRGCKEQMGKADREAIHLNSEWRQRKVEGGEKTTLRLKKQKQ